MKRTPRSTSRRASRQRRPKSRVRLSSMPYSSLRRLGLLAQIDRLRGVRLHLEGQLVAGDAGGQVAVVARGGLMLGVVLVQRVEQAALGDSRHAVGPLQVEDRRRRRSAGWCPGSWPACSRSTSSWRR